MYKSRTHELKFETTHSSLSPKLQLNLPNMAPSATQDAPVPVVQQSKVERLKEPYTPPSKSTVGGDGSIVPDAEDLPEVLTGHREPLKLSGALEEFESFEVTPIIGREYVDVDLAELLRAPNSDDLLRDLAITSKIPG